MRRSNQLHKVALVLLFCSSYSPLFLLVIVRQLFDSWEYVGCWGRLSCETVERFFKFFGATALSLIFLLLGICGTYIIVKNLEREKENGVIVEVEEVSGLNDEPLAYISTYIISVLFQDYSNCKDFVSVVFLLLIMYRLYVRSKLILINPLLSVSFSLFSIKYKAGRVTRQAILLTKDRDIKEEDLVKIQEIGYQLYYGYKR